MCIIFYTKIKKDLLAQICLHLHQRHLIVKISTASTKKMYEQLRGKIFGKQESIPVGCLPSAAVAVCLGVSARRVIFAQGGCLPRGVSAQGGCASKHALRQTLTL